MIIVLSNESFVASEISEVLWKHKKVVYIDTASLWQAGDKSWREKQISAIEKEFWNIQRYSIEWKGIPDFEKDLTTYDIIHIWWGNTAYLLYHIKHTGFDIYLKSIQESKDIVGSSAGGIVLGLSIEHIQALDDFSLVDLDSYTGLWIFDFDIWVHFWSQKYLQKYQQVFSTAFTNSKSGIYIDDTSYIIKKDNTRGISLHTVDNSMLQYWQQQ